MNKPFTKKEQIVFSSLIELFYENITTLEEFFNIEKENEVTFKEKYNKCEFPLFFDANEINNCKTLFIARKIIAQEQPYLDKYEQIIKKLWIDFGLNIELIENFSTEKISKEIVNGELGKRLKNDNQKESIYIEMILSYMLSKTTLYKTTSEEINKVIEFLNNTLDVEDIINTKMYQKYTNRRFKDIVNYINIEESKFIDLIFYFFTNTKTEFSLDIVNKKNKPDLVYDLIGIPSFGSDIFENKLEYFDKFGDNVNYDIIINSFSSIYYLLNKYTNGYFVIKRDFFNELIMETFNDALLIHLKNCIIQNTEHKEFTMSMLIRCTEIKNIEQFLTMWFQLFYMNFLLNYIYSQEYSLIPENKKIKEEIKEDNHKKEVEEKNNIIKKIQSELNISNSKNVRLLEENSSLKSKITTIKKNTEDIYLSEISELKKQLEISNNKIKKLEADVRELDQIRDTLLRTEENEQDKFSLDKVDLSQFKEKRYMFIGGRFELLDKLKSIFPKGKFYHVAPNKGIDVSKTDKIIIFPKNINHPMYWDAIELAKTNNIPFMFSLSTNLENTIRDILEKE